MFNLRTWVSNEMVLEIHNQEEPYCAREGLAQDAIFRDLWIFAVRMTLDARGT